jgi:hypothetical protein
VKELGGASFPANDRRQSHSRQHSNENETSYNDSYHNYQANENYLEATLNDRTQFINMESANRDRNTSGFTRENQDNNSRVV